jgi:polysaccharide deacetylase family protein (PEP-CTERM system associated)
VKQRVLHSISFDVEDWYMVANFRGHPSCAEWSRAEQRLDVGMGRIFAALDRHSAKATFFFLGWVAERRPDLVQEALRRGHEIGSHGWGHEFLWDIGPQGLDDELARTEEALAKAGAPRPAGFRASTFTLTRRTWWAFELLARRGYLYDSSIHPVAHPTYGVPDFDPGISVVQTGSGSVVEFPVATVRAFGRNWPVGGGGYFRLLPVACTIAGLRRVESEGRRAAFYLHPWEFDPDQPRVPVAWSRRFRHYLNLSRTEARLERLLGAFRFGSMRAVLADAGQLPPSA